MPDRIAQQLTLKQLRLIVAIAEHRQLSLAAASLSLSQPAASRSLAEIEQLCDGALFERHVRGMQLTAIGEILTRRARNALAETEAAGAEIEQFRFGRGGNVRIGAVTGAALAYAVPAVQSLSELAPRVAVHLEVATSRDLVRDLLALRLDLALARIPPDVDPAEFDVLPGALEEIDIIVGAENLDAYGSGSVSLADLARRNWIMQTAGAPIRQAIEAALIVRGVTISGRVTQTSSLLATLALLREPDAVAPVSREVANLLTGFSGSSIVHVVELRERVVVAPYSLLSLRGRELPPAALRCKELISTMLLSHSEPKQ